jgi:hypothetical protein
VIRKHRDSSSLRLKNGAVLAVGAKPPSGSAISRDFDLAVLVAHGIHLDGVRTLRLLLPDGELTPSQLIAVRVLAIQVANALRIRKRVFIACHAGLNRSALVAALALRELGAPADKAISLVREMRSGLYPFPLHEALFNDHFLRIVKDA